MMKESNNILFINGSTLIVFGKEKTAEKYFSYLCYPTVYEKRWGEKRVYKSILDDIKRRKKNNKSYPIYCIYDNNPLLNKIYITDYYHKRLKIQLDKFMINTEIIDYYENKIVPILNISKSYNINFATKIPFEFFADDNSSETMHSFSEYYTKLLHHFGVDINNVVTKEISAGKYEMKINNQIIDVRAWDNIESVLDNVDLILETEKQKNKIGEKNITL